MGVHGSKERKDRLLPEHVASKFTSVELDMLRKSFKDLAQRSPGKTIDKQTFLKFFPMPGLHGERLFKVFDHKNTGVIDYEEFITGLAICVRGSFDEKVQLIFQIYDIDNNQHVSKDELRTMLHQIPRQALYILSATVENQELREQLLDQVTVSKGGVEKASNSQVAIDLVDRLVDDAFTSFDLNKDDKLSPEQFKQWVKNTPEVLDFLESVFPLRDTTGVLGSPQHSDSLPRTKSNSGMGDNIASVPPPPPVLAISSDPATINLEGGSEGPSTPKRESYSRKLLHSLSGHKRHGSSGSLVGSTGVAHSDDEGHMSDASGAESISRQSSMAVGDATMTGMLSKVGRRIKKLMNRYFVLRGQVLYYYHTKNMSTPAGIIFLQGCFVTVRDPHAPSSSTSSPSSTGRGLRSQFSEVNLGKGGADKHHTHQGIPSYASHLFPFEIITSQGGERDSRLFFAKTEDERKKWMDAIAKASNVVPFESKYTRLERLGRGKFATVFKCEMTGTNDDKPESEKQYMAVKIIDKSVLNDRERELLRTEIAVLKLVNHPYICGMEDVFESLNHIYIVLEFVEGGELFDRIVGRARLTELEAYPIVKQLAEAVKYLHVLGIVHRDLKPENILVAGSKNVPLSEATLKICDFGLSKLISPKGVMKLACGTLSYVAPEVLSSKGYGKAADIWNIGVILYLVRRGRLPFDGETKEEIIYETIHTELDFKNDAIFSKGSPEQISLMEGLLDKNAETRLTAKQILEHPWMEKMAKEWAELYKGKETMLDLKIPTTKPKLVLDTADLASPPTSPLHSPQSPAGSSHHFFDERPLLEEIEAQSLQVAAEEQSLPLQSKLSMPAECEEASTSEDSAGSSSIKQVHEQPNITKN